LFLCSASAKLTAVVDLPTPPLPEATAIIFLTSGGISTPFCVEYLAIFVQMLRDTLWRGVDYMIIDLPPGTGDTQLTLSQKIPVSGSVIVTTLVVQGLN
jgi:Mrp family chromosome partitioning ATPase